VYVAKAPPPRAPSRVIDSAAPMSASGHSAIPACPPWSSVSHSQAILSQRELPSPQPARWLLKAFDSREGARILLVEG